MNVTRQQLVKAMKNAGHKVFMRGDYNLNLIGIRSRDTKANTFNDLFCVLFKVAGQEVLLQFACTTDPGTYYRQNPLHELGCAVVKPGQYDGVWELGRHQGKYPALVQVGAITVYREQPANDDMQLTDITEQTGYFGINAHRASEQGIASKVNRFSAGCQVIQHPDEYAMLISIVRIAAKKHGNKFSYTLLTEHDVEQQT